MTEKTTSQSQQSQTKQPGFDPSIPMAMGMEAWARISQEGMARFQSMYDELVKLEATAHTRMTQYANDFSVLATESATYAAQLAAEWRKLTLDATKRAGEMFGAKA